MIVGNSHSAWSSSRSPDSSRQVNSDLQSTFDSIFGTSASRAQGKIDDALDMNTVKVVISNKNWRLGLDSFRKKKSGVGAGAAQALDINGFDNYDQLRLTIDHKHSVSDSLHIETRASYAKDDLDVTFDVFPAGTLLPVGNDGNIFTPHDGIGCQNANIPGIGCLTSFSDGFLGLPGIKSEIGSIESSLHLRKWADHEFRVSLGLKYEKMRTSE